MWHICKVKYEGVTENGMNKKFTEQHIIDAINFTDAETGITKAMMDEVGGEFDVVSIKRCTINEVVMDDFGLASATDGEVKKMFGQKSASTIPDKWFKCKLNLIQLDEKSGKEKKSPYIMLVHANSTHSAQELADLKMRKSMMQYNIEQVIETKIVSVWERNQQGSPE